MVSLGDPLGVIMKINISKSIDCVGKTSEACSDDVLTALGHGAAFTLKAEVPTDTVHGSVTILHCDPPELHAITVEIYEVYEAPPAISAHGLIQGRQSTFRRPDPMPTERIIKSRLDQMGRTGR